MPLTQQIIRTIIKDEIKEELKPVNSRLDSIDEKMDKIYDIVVDLAGQFKKFYEEHIVLSGQVSDLTDRVEKLEGVRN